VSPEDVKFGFKKRGYFSRGQFFSQKPVKYMYNVNYKNKEKILLLGVDLGKKSGIDVEESLEELSSLCLTAGGEIEGRIIQKRNSIKPGTYVGKGKAEEIREIIKNNSVETVVFDEELSPAQQRNLEHIVGCKVIDRTQLILDIFAQRARTREGKLQVELAQLHYLLPRLTGKGKSLMQQVGGIGVRGPGEKKLEVDRRRIKDRIAHLELEIESVSRHRHIQREKRQNVPLAVVSLIGYTNSGKSTLLNTLTKAGVLVEDKLFATLDPTIRRVSFPNKQKALFVDTVGFIRKLPHQIIASFRATLEEVVDSDLLLNIIDCSSPYMKHQMTSVDNVLHELKIEDRLRLNVYNKIDLVKDKALIRNILKKDKESVAISAKRGMGIDILLDKVGEILTRDLVLLEYKVPYTRADIVNIIYKKGRVIGRKEMGENSYITCWLDKKTSNQIGEFRLRK